MSSFPLYTLESRAQGIAPHRSTEHSNNRKKYIKNNNNRYDIPLRVIHDGMSIRAANCSISVFGFWIVVPKKVEMLCGVQQGFGENGVSLVDCCCCFCYVDRMSFTWFFPVFFLLFLSLSISVSLLLSFGNDCNSIRLSSGECRVPVY